MMNDRVEALTTALIRRKESLVKKILRNRWPFRLIGVALFVLILTRIDLQELVQTLKGVDLSFVAVSMLIQLLALFVSTIRWHMIMSYLEIRIPLPLTFMHQIVGTGAAQITPGQLGEFVKVLYHRKHGYPLPDSFLSVVIDRAYDLLMLLLFGFVSLSLLFGLSSKLTVVIAGTAVLAAVLAFLFFRRHEESAQLIARVLRRMSPSAYKDVVERDALRLAYKVGRFDWRLLTIAGMLTILNYSLLLMRVYAIVLSLSIQIPIIDFVMIVPLLRLVGLVPVSVLGLGTRDLTSIYLFGRLGVPSAKGLLVSNLGLVTLIFQAAVGLLVWWRLPLHLGQTDGAAKAGEPSEAEA